MAAICTSFIPQDHITHLGNITSGNLPTQLDKPEYSIDSLFGLVASTITAPVYLYASLMDKLSVWDDIQETVPESGASNTPMPASPPSPSSTSSPSAKAYDIDFSADQTSNAPESTYNKAQAMAALDEVIVHRNFTERFPFKNNTLSLITSNSALHNANHKGRFDAVRKIARQATIVDLFGRFKQHDGISVDEMRCKDFNASHVDWNMLFDVLPCLVLRATKPSTHHVGVT